MASGATSIPEVTDEAALQVDPIRVESIVDGMQQVLTESALNKSMRKAGF